MGSIIFESRNILHASRNAIAALTESYEQKLLAWYHAHENLKAEHKTTKAKLEEERQQLEIARRAMRFNESALAEYQKVRQNNQAQNRGNREMQQMKIALNKAEDRAKIAEEKVSELEEEKTDWTRKHCKELAAETSQDMQQRSHKIRKEEGASKETDDCTIVVEMRGDSGQPFIG